ncbi:sugar kinase [Novosphingobium sp. FSY-8]|uniref:Sugar kinase n=1 Tax=Novosphingobium ovatum TaxID=1908523 RepID=A0ABW9XDM9_9SPHN|nr:sugar kinase [Novosphingobium ovatum]NBC36639.1 sugar kinase [Novosphingobium ovatum]
MARVACFGEALLRLSTPNGRRLSGVDTLDVVAGGAEANVAATLAGLGHGVRYASCVPGNGLGDRFVGAMRGAGVDVTHLRRGAGRMGVYYLETGSGVRPAQITYDRDFSAFVQADPDAFDWDGLLAGADLLHLSGIIPALGPNGVALIRAALAAARGAGVPVSFDPNYRVLLWQAWAGDAAAILSECVDQADILFANHRDLALLTGRDLPADTPDQRRAVADLAFATFPRLRWMASTQRAMLGHDHHRLSARVDARDGGHETAPVDVTAIVDRVGTGDAFAAGVLHSWLMGADVAQAARDGLTLGAVKHGIHGDFCQISAGELTNLANGGGDIRR